MSIEETELCRVVWDSKREAVSIYVSAGVARSLFEGVLRTLTPTAAQSQNLGEKVEGFRDEPPPAPKKPRGRPKKAAAEKPVFVEPDPPSTDPATAAADARDEERESVERVAAKIGKAALSQAWLDLVSAVGYAQAVDAMVRIVGGRIEDVPDDEAIISALVGKIREEIATSSESSGEISPKPSPAPEPRAVTKEDVRGAAVAYARKFDGPDTPLNEAKRAMREVPLILQQVAGVPNLGALPDDPAVLADCYDAIVDAIENSEEVPF